jgi:hypothetical protein
MAGSDDGGEKFAAVYDDVARNAMERAFDFADDIHMFAREFAACGNLHATAELRARGDESMPYGFDDPGAAVDVCRQSLPTSSGGDAVSVPGLDVIIDYLGSIIWPNADTGKLRSAEAAWKLLGDDLESSAREVRTWRSDLSSVVSDEKATLLTEIDELAQAMEDFAGDVGGPSESLASVCGEYAEQVDQTREQSLIMLRDLLIEIAVGAAVSAALSLVTFGAAGAVGAGAIAVRIGIVAGKISSLLGRLVATAIRLLDKMHRILMKIKAFARFSNFAARQTLRARIVYNSIDSMAGAAASTFSPFYEGDRGITILSAGVAGSFGGLFSSARFMDNFGGSALSGGLEGVIESTVEQGLANGTFDVDQLVLAGLMGVAGGGLTHGAGGAIDAGLKTGGAPPTTSTPGGGSSAPPAGDADIPTAPTGDVPGSAGGDGTTSVPSGDGPAIPPTPDVTPGPPAGDAPPVGSDPPPVGPPVFSDAPPVDAPPVGSDPPPVGPPVFSDAPPVDAPPVGSDPPPVGPPVFSDAPPVDAPPVGSDPPPVGPPVFSDAPPVDAPPVNQAPPVDAPPVDGPPADAPPADSDAPPADAPPADSDVPPADAPPADSDAPPADAPPADSDAPPADAPPADSDVPPADAPPADSDVPPADSDAPPADSDVPPPDGEAPGTPPGSNSNFTIAPVTPAGIGPVPLKPILYEFDGVDLVTRPIPPMPDAARAFMDEGTWAHVYSTNTHNMDGSTDTLGLGKFIPPPNNQMSYEVVARRNGDGYFNMDSGDWHGVKDAFGMTDDDMFDVFNRPLLDEAGTQGYDISYSSNPTIPGAPGPNGQPTLTALNKEHLYLTQKWNYIWDPVTNTMRPRP